VPSPLPAQETWDQFIRQREANVNRQAFSETADILVVFEDDVYATVPDIKTAMVAEIENMESDIKYLGWCMWNDHNMVRGELESRCFDVVVLTNRLVGSLLRLRQQAPLCMHAYAMDVHGARKLRKYVDVCSVDPLDIQVRQPYSAPI